MTQPGMPRNGNGNGTGAGYYAASGPGYAGAAPAGAPAPYAPEPEPEGMTLRDYLGVLWRRKWVILIVVLVATAAAYYFSARQPAVYEASADLIYEKQLDVANPLTGQGNATDLNERSLELRSVANIIGSPDMQERARKELAKQDVAVTATYTVSSEPVVDTSAASGSSQSNVVRITAQSNDPELAAAAANAYSVAFVQYKKEAVQEQIGNAMDAIKREMRSYPEAAKESTDYLVLAQRLQDLQILDATATGNYRKLVPASVPTEPVAPKPLRSAILGFGVGLFAGIGLAFLLEQFDTRVQRPDQIAALLRQPILGRVPRISRKLLGESALVALREPDGHVAEAFRMVRTNLDFMAVDGDIKSIVLTSCMKGEGKSVTVSNLAVSMAMAGKKIIVIDADLRRPRQHKYFGLDNEKGLSTVAAGKHTLAESLVRVDIQPPVAEGQAAFQDWGEGSDARSALYVLPSGPIPPNPGEIVASRRFSAILEELCDEADLVLVDSPAMLAVGDTSAIAARCDGLVFLADLHQIKKPQLLTAADQLARLPVRMLGVVVRMAGKSGSRYYYSPYYYYGYSYAEDGSKVKERRRRGTGRRAEDDARV